jgi:hypothetical protein
MGIKSWFGKQGMRAIVTCAFIAFVPMFALMGELAISSVYGGALIGFYMKSNDEESKKSS